LEAVLGELADYGVDDYEIVIAVALHRHMTAAEVRRMVGDQIFDAHWPDRLYNHDAEAPDGMTELGRTAHGEPVRINRRAAESDLLIYVNINLVPMDGGHKSVAVGLTDWEGLKAHHNPGTIKQSWSYMDPEKSEMHRSCTRLGRIVDEHLNVFHIETALNNRMFTGPMDFLMKSEDDFTELDRLKFQGMKYALGKTPRALRREIFMRVPAAYELIAVAAGRTEPVHAKILDAY
jgi:nickel-dependent lactate racemase